MKIIVAYSKNNRVKVKAVGKTINLLTLVIGITKYLVERVSDERGVGQETAENIIIDCVKDGMKIMKD